MLKPPKVASRPAGGLRGAVSAPEQNNMCVNWTHGFFITINSTCMIQYFKHIIHIDDFALNGHPPSLYYVRMLTYGWAY